MTYYELIDKLSRRFSEWISYLALRDLAEADLVSAIAWAWFSLFTLQILTTGTSIEVKPISPLKDPITALYVLLLFAIALVLSGGISLLPRLIYARIQVRKAFLARYASPFFTRNPIPSSSSSPINYYAKPHIKFL